MKDATYIKVKEGKLWASDMVKDSYYYDGAMEAFNQSFIEVGNPEVAQLNDEIIQVKDGIYPAPIGLQFEVRNCKMCYGTTLYEIPFENPVHCHYCTNGKVAILSLKQEQPYRLERPVEGGTLGTEFGAQEQPSEEKDGEYKEIKIGEVFHVEGKHYAFRLPKTASEKPNTDHGHILHEIIFVKD